MTSRRTSGPFRCVVSGLPVVACALLLAGPPVAAATAPRPGSAGVSLRPAAARATPRGAMTWKVPADSDQLIMVSSPTYDPPDYLATLQTFSRANAFSPWQAVFPSWQAETGYGHFVNVRHEGDGATPTGTFAISSTMYGNSPNPGGLHSAYHHLVCGDWWDEDPYSPQYNEFVHVACGTTPPFASWSEALWTETQAYPYFAVLETNNDPVIGGADAPGSGIFLHNWVGGPTAGCVALPLGDLLSVLRWLRPALHPAIEIGTDAELRSIPPSAPPVRWSVALHSGAGYWLASSGGSVVPFGTARLEGAPDSLPGPPMSAPVVALASVPAARGQGYWTVTAAGQVSAFGRARRLGSPAPRTLRRLGSPVVGMAVTEDGGGYWLATASGRVFAFGDARVEPGHPAHGRVVAIAAGSTGDTGYYLLTADGGVTAYGSARWFGSPRADHRLVWAAVGLLSSPGGNGYWIALRDGGVLNYGHAPWWGSAARAHPAGPVVGVTRFAGGYALYAVPGSLPAHPHQYQFPAPAR